MKPLFTTQQELIDFLTKLSGAGEVVLTTCTEVIMRKSDVATGRVRNPFKDVLKIQAVRVLINADYEHRVNQQRRIEGKKDDFIVEGLVWGQCTNNIVVEHKGKKYIKTIELAKVAVPMYMANGVGISFDEIKAFLPKPPKARKQAVNEDVRVRTFTIDNIVALEVGDKLVFEKQPA